MAGLRGADPAGLAPGLSGFAEVEHAGGPQLALLDLAEGHEVALASGVSRSRRRQVVAADEDRLAAQEPNRILATDPENGQVGERRLDRTQQSPERALVRLGGG